MSQQPPTLTITELTMYLKGLVEEMFPSVWVEGEVSNLSRPRSGHVYLTLKDEQTQIKAVMWRSTAAKLPFDLCEGQHVLAFGGVEIYGPQGVYQLVIRKLEPQGIGALQLAFQQLQAKLQAEGLFAAERKKPIPAFPKRIGIVTSPSGAAIRDFLEIALRRWPQLNATIIPAKVQGPGAAQEIAAAIKAAQRIKPALDVLVVTRGGGSMEDLWCFNEEVVVRAIANCKIPTVSAVGHEIDVTLADFAADHRALTPSDAAQRVVPDVASINEYLLASSLQLDRRIRSSLDSFGEQIRQLEERAVLKRQHEYLRRLSQQVDDKDRRATLAMKSIVNHQRQRIQHCVAQLTALNPLAILTRGYSVTLSEPEQRVLKSIRQVSVGQSLKTQLSDGAFHSYVTAVD